MRRLLVATLLVSLPFTAQACLNDRDSDALAVQNQRFPEALRVITGRFERNPPRYYQMRIARVSNELKSNPRRLSLYDDLAVAHDRLGDDVTAMRVMSQKRSVLPPYNAHDKADKEAWYRYYANDGTFRVHNFLHTGAKVEHLSELKRARNEIAQALRINPNAHFNREKYQLAVMDWILAVKTKKTEYSLADFLEERFQWDDNYGQANLSVGRQEAAQGLSGLIVLGVAWQSPDVFDALASALDVQKTIALSHLARQRCDELQHNGHLSLGSAPIGLDTDGSMMESETGLKKENAKSLDELYPNLRAEADQWTTQRNKWMEARFALGQHPDTTPTFWQGFPQAQPPSLDIAWTNQLEDRRRAVQNTINMALATFGGFVLLGLFLIFGVKRLKNRPTMKTSSP